MAIDAESTRAARQSGGRPQFLVLFDHPSERNAALLAEVTGSQERIEDVIAGTSGKTTLERSDGSPAAKVFHNLAAAAARLTPQEAAKLDAQPGVDVVPIEVRRVPPHRVYEANPRLDLASADTRSQSTSYQAREDPTSLLWDSGESTEATEPDLRSDPVTAYFLGIRDMVELALRRLQSGAQPVTPPSARTPTGTLATRALAHSWCLSMLGVGPHVPWLGRGVTVAVLDTGVDLQHPDLSPRLASGNVKSFVPGATAQDGDGHGTHCAGVIGARIPSSGRRYSVAPECTLLVGKVLADDGHGYDDWILEGMQWAAARGARVISMSLGSDRALNADYDPAYERIAATLLEQNVIVVSAAGNSSERPQFCSPVENPAACPSLLAVAAVDRARGIAGFSCSAMDFAQVDISAPGVGVFSAYPGNRHVYMDGTSMATPHVAGLAALILEQAPGLAGKQLWQELLTRAHPGGPSSDFGAGVAHL